MKKGIKFKRQYFKIADDKVIYPASVLTRIAARLIDFFMIWIPAFIITIIYVPISTNSGSIYFSETVPQQYDAVLMFSWSLTIAIALVLLIIFPYFNKKNPGQTLGKKVLGITPLYLGNKNEKNAYIVRELPILILFILPAVFELALGYDAQSFYLEYSNFLRANFEISDPNIIYPQMFDFFSNYWGATADPNQVMSDNQLISTFGVAMAYSQVISSMLFLVVVFVLWISMIVETQKRGYHDMLAKTAVVNLKTVSTLENAERRYNELVGNFSSVVTQTDQTESVQLDVPITEEDKNLKDSENIILENVIPIEVETSLAETNLNNNEQELKTQDENLNNEAPMTEEVKVEESLVIEEIKVGEAKTEKKPAVKKTTTTKKASTVKKTTTTKKASTVKKTTSPTKSSTVKKTTTADKTTAKKPATTKKPAVKKTTTTTKKTTAKTEPSSIKIDNKEEDKK